MNSVIAKNFIAVMLLFCLSFTAESKNLDSLINILKSNPKDSIFRIAANDLYISLASFNPEVYKPKLIQVFQNRGEEAQKENKYKTAAQSFQVLALMYEVNLIQDSAIYYHFKSTSNFEKAGDFKNMAQSYYRIARIYFYKGTYMEANRYVNILLNYYLQKGEEYSEGLVSTYMFKAIILQNIPDSLPKASSIYKKAIDIAEKQQLKILGILYNNYGEYLNMAGNPVSESFKYFEKAKEQAEITKDTSIIAYASYCIGNISHKLNKNSDAVKAILPYLSFWNRTGRVNDLLLAYEILHQSYEGMADYKNAVIYMKKQKALNDSLIKLTNSQTLAELDTKYQVEKKDKQLLQLKEKAAIEQLEKEKQENKSMMLMIGIGVSLLLGGFALYAYFNKQKANKLLDNEKKLVEQQKEILEVKNKEILDSINYAKRIQNAILPSDQSFVNTFNESFIYYQPKDIVAGDFYWLYKKENTIYLAVCDCTGHGVPGAMVSVVCSNSLERAVNEFNLSKPSDILNKTRDLVKVAFIGNENNVNDGMDMSLISFEFTNSSEKEIQFSGANNSVWYTNKDVMEELKADKQPIGNYTAEKPFTNHTVKISKDTCLYLFTDGYADQFGGPKGKKFKYKQLNEVLLSNHNKPLSEQKEILKHTFENWRGDLEQVDDVCVIGIKI
ncbi:MAG: SpoIIE family protein phosphatase [Bacteroidetes bacterium]|nr:SpoIIE family protein phosphatase [Bacteroidota bacterium]